MLVWFLSIAVIVGLRSSSSHIIQGFLQAMEDEGVPIDMIGGCSIGAFIGGLYAKDGSSALGHIYFFGLASETLTWFLICVFV